MGKKTKPITKTEKQAEPAPAPAKAAKAEPEAVKVEPIPVALLRAALQEDLLNIIRRYSVPMFRDWLVNGTDPDLEALETAIAQALKVPFSQVQKTIDDFIKALGK